MMGGLGDLRSNLAHGEDTGAIRGLQDDPLMVTVFVNGIPSVSRMVNAGDMLLRLYLPALMK